MCAGSTPRPSNKRNALPRCAPHRNQGGRRGPERHHGAVEIHTKLLTPDDPVLETVLGWHWHEWSAEEDGDLESWRDRLRSRARSDDIPFTLVARLDSEPVGCLTVCKDDVDARFADHGPWLSGMLVVGRARDLGVGRALLAQAAERARDFGATELWLYTSEAARFYERCGYKVAHSKERLLDNAVLWREL
jgi:GNAT superfamily N-acetyltransferase